MIMIYDLKMTQYVLIVSLPIGFEYFEFVIIYMEVYDSKHASHCWELLYLCHLLHFLLSKNGSIGQIILYILFLQMQNNRELKRPKYDI